MSFFEKHVFVCVNQREAGIDCCNNHRATEAVDFLKDEVKKRGLNVPGKVRISSAGCLGRCDNGPVMVVYPEGTWYSYFDQEDLQEIVEKHLVENQPVERLKL